MPEAVEPASFEGGARALDPALALSPSDSPSPLELGAAAQPTRARLAWELLHDLSVAVLLCCFVVAFVGQPFRVQGTSMQPLLRDGERILVNKLVYRFRPIERGDVVVFWWPRDPTLSFVKRVVARPGDVVELRSGRLYVNRRAVEESYLAAEYRDHDDVPAHEVADGFYYVLGDHRNGSNDSRSWGEVPEKYIYGRAAFRFWPFSRWGPIR